MFSYKKRFLKRIAYSKIKKTLLDSYNFLIAIDPIVTTLTQSSPFEGGKYYAKDTRMLFLRGGKRLKFDGLYNKLQLLGALPPYKQTSADLIETLKKKDKLFIKLLKKINAPEKLIEKKSRLDFIWNPVKINQIGTIEQRGMDTNYLSVCLGISVMIKFVLRAIQQEFYQVLPSDIGIQEPFKLEGNLIFIPPHTHVRNKWQRYSAYEGFSNKKLYDACLHFYSLANKLIYKEYAPTLKPIKDMLNKKKTLSDDIIDYAKRKGYTDSLPQELCRQIALLHAKRMIKANEKLREIYANLE